MKYLTTREEMQKIDAYSIEEIGIPGLVLMEKAALSMANEIMDLFSVDKSILIVVEMGNNGGDGMALGRLLVEKGYQVDFYEIGGLPKASQSYKTQRKILDNLGIPVLNDMPCKDYDLVVDGIFGVGLKREVAGIQRQVIERLNKMDSYKIAVDVPSGVDAGNGQVLGMAFQADLTITFGLLKIGLVLYPGASYCGKISVKDIGFPKLAIEKIGPSAYTYNKEDLWKLPKRKPWSNKGTYGKVLIVAGSYNMAGAACLCGQAAYRSGSGLVRVFTCEENRTIMQNQLPEAILTTYREENAVETLKDALSWATVVGFGPGLGISELGEKMLRCILEEARVPLVIDADGLNLLAGLKEKNADFMRLVDQYEYGMIFTPHLMEMSRLCGKTVPEIKNSLIETAAMMADSRHIYVLKDARTIVSDGSDKTYINTCGNDGMSVGGSGDVLTGIICGLLAGGANPADAARLGVLCHGLAGDEAVKEIGHYGMLATDIIKGLSKVLP